MQKCILPMGNAPDLIPTAAVAKRLGKSVATINRWAAEGKLRPAIELEGKTGARLFHRSDVDALADEASEAAS